MFLVGFKLRWKIRLRAEPALPHFAGHSITTWRPQPGQTSAWFRSRCGDRRCSRRNRRTSLRIEKAAYAAPFLSCLSFRSSTEMDSITISVTGHCTLTGPLSVSMVRSYSR